MGWTNWSSNVAAFARNAGNYFPMFIIDERSFMKLIMTWTMYCMIAFQVIAILIALFVPFGFDHASSYGLDFADFMRLVYLHGLALCVGVGLSFATRHYILATIQVLATIWVVLEYTVF